MATHIFPHNLSLKTNKKESHMFLQKTRLMEEEGWNPKHGYDRIQIMSELNRYSTIADLLGDITAWLSAPIFIWGIISFFITAEDKWKTSLLFLGLSFATLIVSFIPKLISRKIRFTICFGHDMHVLLQNTYQTVKNTQQSDQST